MTYFATEEQLHILKNRALEWQSDGYPGADPLIPEIMDIINRIPNLVPVFSCEGHPSSLESNVKLKHFYIMFAVNELGFKTLVNIYEKLRERLIQQSEENFCYQSVTGLLLNITTRSWPIKKDNIFYNVIILGGKTFNKEMKDNLIKELMVILTEIKVEEIIQPVIKG